MSKAVEIEGYMLRVHTRHYDKVNGVVVCYKGENDKMFFPFRRPHGEWKYEPKLRLVDETDDGAIYETEMKCFCSACGADFGFQKVDDAFCKYCGAKMVREGEEK